jgi:hypothetical protein
LENRFQSLGPKKSGVHFDVDCAIKAYKGIVTLCRHHTCNDNGYSATNVIKYYFFFPNFPCRIGNYALISFGSAKHIKIDALNAQTSFLKFECPGPFELCDCVGRQDLSIDTTLNLSPFPRWTIPLTIFLGFFIKRSQNQPSRTFTF